jgi:riboflavin kinase/FMN adenylyltransferase
MELIEGLENIRKPYKNAVITIGNFDGVHIGHQALFHQVMEKADELNGTSIAITFEPHPLRVLKPNGNPPLITLYEQKKELIEKSGLDVLICIPFTKEFADITARAFVEDILVRQIGMRGIVIGQDYTFGKNREGNLERLKKFGNDLGFEVVVMDWIRPLNTAPDRISSTRIRDLVTAGEVSDANKLLGRDFQVRGWVESGRDRGGKLLGFPTANVKLHDELCPKAGVYAVSVECMGSTYMGVANIGYSPTFEDHLFTVEVHILEFDDDLYGQQIRVNFVQRMRGEIKFSSIEKLIQQIKTDVETAREILSA